MRIPPHSIEAEVSLLGGLLLDGEAFDEVAALLAAEDLYKEQHRHIFRAMEQLSTRGAAIDMVTVTQQLQDEKRLDAVGGVGYVGGLVAQVPTAANVSYYAQIVRKKALLRRVIALAGEMAEECYGDVGDIEEFLGKTESKLFALTDSRMSTGYRWIRDVAMDAFHRIEELYEREADITGVPSGFVDLDKMTAGWQPSDLIIVAARPAMGKCLTGDARILLADGRVERLEELVARGQAEVLTLGGDRRLGFGRVSAFIADGRKPVYRVRLRSGRELRATGSHPLLTPGGWRPVIELGVGERVAVPRVLPVFGVESRRQCELRLLGLLLGGGDVEGSTPRFVTQNEQLLADFVAGVRDFGGSRAVVSVEGSGSVVEVVADVEAHGELASRLRAAVGVRRMAAGDLARGVGVAPEVVAGWLAGAGAPEVAQVPQVASVLGIEASALLEAMALDAQAREASPIRAWLERLGVWGQGRSQRCIPGEVFELRRPDLELFLSRLLAPEGRVEPCSLTEARARFVFEGEALARQVQHLLLRFGVCSALCAEQIIRNGIESAAWRLEVTSREALWALVTRVGVLARDEALIDRLRWLMPSEEEERAQKARGHVVWDEIVALEHVGEEEVYDLTVPGTHNFIANDVCVHNTALTLNMACNAAVRFGKTVLYCSLEMSAEQLAVRLMASEARIDVSRMRTGQLKENEWGRLMKAVTTLAKAPLFLDDTASLSPQVLASRARRLKAERDLHIIFIDYLQLMDTLTPNINSREQQIGDISRKLKMLAKDLGVPIIALAQLNRGVEQRADKRPMMSDLRECVPAETPVWLADGRRVPIGALVGQTPEVLAFEEGRVVPATAERVWSVGVRPLLRVTLASGRVIRGTAQHRLMGAQGWAQLAELEPGDRLALARAIPAPEHPVVWPPYHTALLGHLIGDGSYLKGQPLRYTSASEENLEEVATSAREGFGVTVSRHEGRGNWDQLVFSGNGNRWKPLGLNAWLRRLGIFDQRSHEKRLPDEVFRLGSDQVAEVLGGLWATDGSVTLRYDEGHRPTRGRIYLGTSSQELAQDICAALLRLGIVGRIHRVAQGEHRPSWQIDVSGRDEQLRFLELVPMTGPRHAPAAELRRFLVGSRSNTNVDTLPREVFGRVRLLLRERGMTQRQMAERRGTSFGGASHFSFSPSRAVVSQYAEILEDPELQRLVDAEVFWDRIVSIEPDGEAEVFDLTVPGPSSWLADGVVSHNSGAIEQDADIISFVYRDEYYNEDSEDKGLGEVILGKHRSGSTGTVKLKFFPQYTRFENLARDEEEPF